MAFNTARSLDGEWDLGCGLADEYERFFAKTTYDRRKLAER
jgi:hypothetical protein